jgi:hypothetical protein
MAVEVAALHTTAVVISAVVTAVAVAVAVALLQVAPVQPTSVEVVEQEGIPLAALAVRELCLFVIPTRFQTLQQLLVLPKKVAA